MNLRFHVYQLEPELPFRRIRLRLQWQVMSKTLLKRMSGRGFATLSWGLKKFGYRVERLDHVDYLQPLLYRRLAKSPDFYFVQIGANDGHFGDPIRDFAWRNQVSGLVVEPLKDFFAQLTSNYGNCPNVKPVNVALHAAAKSMPLHRVDPAKAGRLGDWTQGIASFRKEHHVMAQVPDDVMITEIVTCVTLKELLDQHSVGSYDLLQIDTEGYDYEIIKMVEFERRKPAMIRFEHGLPAGTMSHEQFQECVALLMSHGYYVITEPFDAIAYQPSMF